MITFAELTERAAKRIPGNNGQIKGILQDVKNIIASAVTPKPGQQEPTPPPRTAPSGDLRGD